MDVRLEKLVLKSFESAVVGEGVERHRFVLPTFGADEKKPEAAPPPPPAPTFSESQLKAGEQEGYRRGFLEGTKEGKQQAESEQAGVDRDLTEAVKQVAEQIQQLLTEYNGFARERQAEVPALALAIARKVAGQALDINPLPLIESLAIQCLERLLGEPQILVTVNDRLAPAMENRLITHFAGNSDPGEISIMGDAAMQPTDLRVEWAFGKAERNTEEVWRQVEQLIGQMVANHGPHETTTPVMERKEEDKEAAKVINPGGEIPPAPENQ